MTETSQEHNSKHGTLEMTTADSQRKVRLEKQRLKRAAKMALETTAESDARKKKHREYMAARRAAEKAHETQTETEERLKRCRLQAAAKKETLNPEQLQAQKQKHREYMAARRAATASSVQEKQTHKQYVAAQRIAKKVQESETDTEARLCRLRLQAAARRAAKQTQLDGDQSVGDSLLIAKLLEMDEVGTLTPVTPATKHFIMEQLADAIGPKGLDEGVCCVCDELAMRAALKSYSANNDTDLLYSMSCRLRNPEPDQLHPDLVAFYDCSKYHPKFSELMLSSRGMKISRTGDNDVIFDVCQTCMRTLSQPVHFDGYDSSDESQEQQDGPPEMKNIPVSEWPLPPKFAISNHFFVGALPTPLTEATWAELLMCSLITVVAQTRVLRGGQHRSIRSHLILFDSIPGPAATLLPIKLNRDTLYKIVLAGPFTDEQILATRKRHTVRHAMVQDLLSFYKQYNHLYRNVKVDETFLESLPKDIDGHVPDGVFHFATDISSNDAEAVDRQQASIGGFSGDPMGNHETNENVYLERAVIFTPTVANLTEQHEQNTINHLEAKVNLCNPIQHQQPPEFQIQSSNKFSDAFDPFLDAKAHPHLFPFGRGFAGEPNRRVKCTKLECTRHYCLLSLRQFARDRYYTLSMFDRLSLERGYMHAVVSCKAKPSQHTPIATITSAELWQGLQNRRRRRCGHVPLPNNTTNSAVSQMLNQVDCSAAQVWGSNAERRVHRRNAFATSDMFGQPALFVTLTPRTDNTLAIAFYAGGVTVDSLFDANYHNHMVSGTECHQLSLQDDIASARLFDRLIKSFLTVVLGFNPGKRLPTSDGGLFGHVKAYYGMVETQGRGTLHLHLILWLYGSPRTTTEFEWRRTDDPQYETSIMDYAESVVTNTLPIDVLQHPCSSCGHQGPCHIELPIPHTAYQSPFRRNRHGFVPAEPLLAKCQSCNIGVSSQHLIRQALLKSHPNLPTEAKEQLVNANLPSKTYTSPERDPFFQDDYTKEILAMPFSHDYVFQPEDPVMNFIVSMLVFLLQMHWWHHCASCFKQSRSTNGAHNVCRYQFPQKQCNEQAILPSSIQLLRPVGHEYINGYNSTIMQTFRCNHDIQILIGGSEMAERMYYACKYTTKDQQKVECKIALALANFERRNDRNKEAETMGSPLSDEIVCRKRLTSHLYHMTNKHETAGPLCALFILRQSCAYQSHVYKILPLRQMLHQLMQNRQTQFELAATMATNNSHADEDDSDAESLGSDSTTSAHDDCSVRSRVDDDQSDCTDDQSNNVESEVLQLHHQQNVTTPTTPVEQVMHKTAPDTGAASETTDANQLVGELQQPNAPSNVYFRFVGPLDDYLFRPPEYENLSVYEFVSSCFRAVRTAKTPASRLFKPGHPLSNIKCIGEHKFDRIPVLSAGMKLPLYEDCKTDNDLDYHAQLALLLFKPFTSLEELCNVEHGQSWHEAWLQFEPTMSTFCRQRYTYMQDYHVGRKLAAKALLSCAEQESVRIDRNYVSPDAGHDEDYDSFDMERLAWNKRSMSNQNNNVSSSTMFADLEMSDCCNDNTSPDGIYSPNKMTHEFRMPFRYPTTEKNSNVDLSALHSNNAMAGAANLAKATYTHVVGDSVVDQRLHFRQQHVLNVDDLKAWSLEKKLRPKQQPVLLEKQTDNNQNEETNTLIHFSTQILETRVTIFTNALCQQRSTFKPRIKPRGTPPDALQQYPYVDDVSYAFGLKYRQHIAFVTMAQALLKTWREREDTTSSALQPITSILDHIGQNQLLFFLYGCGGTGKSHVINAIEAFCIAWGKPGAIAKTAMTGKAAVGINGKTLHSFLGMHNFEGRDADDIKGIPGFTEDLCMVLVDEASMMCKKKVSRMNTSLQKETRNELPFGGLHVVLIGDIFQLPPVVGQPMFYPPLTNKAHDSDVVHLIQESNEAPSYNSQFLSRKKRLNDSCATSPSKRLKTQHHKLAFNEYDQEGYRLWRLFTKVVILDENVRFEDDPELGHHVELARVGNWTDVLIDIINSRLLPFDGNVCWDQIDCSEEQQQVFDVLSGGRNKDGQLEGWFQSSICYTRQ